MRKIRTSGSVGAPGEQSPGATRPLGYVDKVDEELRDSLDHIIATLHRLTQR
jgi:hypothetical protein